MHIHWDYVKRFGYAIGVLYVAYLLWQLTQGALWEQVNKVQMMQYAIKTCAAGTIS